MNKKYLFSLVALTLLTSCNANVSEEPTPIVENESEVIQEINIETDIVSNTEIPTSTEDSTETSSIIELNETYTSPGGEEEISFTLEIENNTIISASAVGNTDNKISQVRQSEFIQALSDTVVGKTVEEAQTVGIIGGSSLTSEAFQTALKKM